MSLPTASDAGRPSLAPSVLPRQLGLVGLAATGICSMLGAAINVIPLMIQRNVPGIGPWVLTAYLVAMVPAILAAIAYASLSSAMPRAGGSYLFVSRGLNPYLGFVASFSQWFGLSVAIGVVSYLIVPFLRDIAVAVDFASLGDAIMDGWARPLVALAFLWTFVLVNVLGTRAYERTLVPLMILMFLGGGVVILAGFHFDHAAFEAALLARGEQPAPATSTTFDLGAFLAASVLLFSSFIGFDSIAQAGGEARRPSRDLPLAIGIAVIGVGSFYIAFTAAIYHTVPWQWVADRAQSTDLTAPGLLGYLLAPGWTVVIVAGAAIALINDLPAMLLSVSRLMFAWAEDGIFPTFVARVHERWRSPYVAIVGSALMASAAILGSHLAGDFFLGVDLLVIAMLVNFMLVCVSLLALRRRRPDLHTATTFLVTPWIRDAVGAAGTLLLGLFLVVQIGKDLAAPVDAWYFRSTWLWLVVMGAASLVFARAWRAVAADPEQRAALRRLPPG